MVWLSLALLLVALSRGWVVAPMLLFALPFAVSPAEAFLVHQGLDFGHAVPAALQGFTVQLVSLAGLAVLALHRRRL